MSNLAGIVQQLKKERNAGTRARKDNNMRNQILAALWLFLAILAHAQASNNAVSRMGIAKPSDDPFHIVLPEVALHAPLP
jgi:hypothetical protein